MKLELKFFGITKEIIQKDSLLVELENEQVSVKELMERMKKDFPALGELNSLLIAVNSEYAEPNTILFENDEIAFIPPVSGG